MRWRDIHSDIPFQAARRGLIPAVLVLALAAFQHAGAAENTNALSAQVRQLSEKFVHTSLALDPATATAQGYHEHRGVALDEQLDDFSPESLNRARQFYRSTLAEANRLPGEKLAPEFRADLDVIRLECQSRLLDLERIQSYRHNPTIYVEILGNALYTPFVLNYAPESKRLRQITARIEKIPAFLATARQNLVDSPAVWAQVAQEENQGPIDLIDASIRKKIPTELKARYNAASSRALTALREFNGFLKNDLARHQSDWRLGSALYAEKFKLTLATGDTPQQALADAEARLKSIREDMRQQALAVYPRFFPGKTPPGDVNTLVSQVLDRIAREHASPQQYFADAKRDLAETTQFVRDHHLLAIPAANKLEVIPTPQFMRGIYAVGGFSPAPALEPRLGSYFWITPFTSDMTPARIESKLREYNFYGLKILTVHEAMPGHYVQFEYADEVEPAWRRALRAIYSNGPYVEGWAVYATEIMIDAGYQDTPEMRLTFAKQMLRVVSNTILDIKLQTMGMTDREAMDLMVNDTFQEQEEALKKLQRAKLSSCQLPTYFVGWRGWDRLRDSDKRRTGTAFQISDFNERALREGAVPLPVLSGLLAHTGTPR